MRLIFLLPGKLPLALMRFMAECTAFIVRHTFIRKMVQENMSLLLPKGQATSQNAADLIKNTSYALFELLSLPYFRPEHFQAINQVVGIENIAAALTAGKGAILISIHAGNYEIMPSVVSMHGYPISSVLKADDAFLDFLNLSRTLGGGKLINVNRENMFIESSKALKKNELIMILSDTGALDSRHIMHKFLGREVPIATGWITLAQRAECAVIPVTCKKTREKNLITFHSPQVITHSNREEVIGKIINIYEDFIRNNPDQWYIFYNTYETRRMVEG
ncbi:MAG: lysophospholipid acyltransferase family protein [Candidatus Margulisbacteria bacterium]|nr:lysophospholipid acyltransferase family protein [Candidatus Margulisiibacteriota bacterium]